MFLKDWLWFNKIKIYDEDVKHELTFPKKVEGEKAPMTREIINTLVEKTKSKKGKQRKRQTCQTSKNPNKTHFKTQK